MPTALPTVMSVQMELMLDALSVLLATSEMNLQLPRVFKVVTRPLPAIYSDFAPSQLAAMPLVPPALVHHLLNAIPVLTQPNKITLEAVFQLVLMDSTANLEFVRHAH